MEQTFLSASSSVAPRLGKSSAVPDRMNKRNRMKPQLPVNLVNPVNPVQFLSLSGCLRVSVVNPSVSNHRRLQGTHVAAWDMSGQTNAGEAIRRRWLAPDRPGVDHCRASRRFWNSRTGLSVSCSSYTDYAHGLPRLSRSGLPPNWFSDRPSRRIRGVQGTR